MKFKIDKAQIEDTVNAFIYDKVTKRQTEQHFNQELNNDLNKSTK